MSHSTGPRGEPSWPDWRQAKAGTRVRLIATGREGTFVRPASAKHNGAIVDWDPPADHPEWGVSRGRVPSVAFDLEPVAD